MSLFSVALFLDTLRGGSVARVLLVALFCVTAGLEVAILHDVRVMK